MVEELRALVIALELAMHLLQLNKEAGFKVGIELHPLELILVILAVLVEDLAYANQFS